MIARPQTLALFLLLTLLLAACAGNGEKHTGEAPHMTPMPQRKAVRDPGNGEFMDVIAQYVARQNGPHNTRYEFTRVDLNGDGRREGLVLMKTPHKFWCNDYGCRMAVFRASNDGFSLLSELHPVRGPLVVMDEKTNGWKNILARVSGRSGWDAKNVVLRFDGRGYPAQPAYQPSGQYSMNDLSGTQIFP